MSSRDSILQRIRSQTRTMPQPGCPPVPEVWPRTGASSEQLVERFTAELHLVQGEVLRCGSIEDARRKLLELMDLQEWKTIGAVDKPLCRELLSDVGRISRSVTVLPADRVAWQRENWDPKEIAQLPAGLVAADHLLADTGSCVVSCDTPEQRLMCYLPPVCVVAARVERLCEHLPAAWREIAPRVAEPDRRGEFVIITGPSRTADIEKILILGVHGPKRLVVLLIG
jgi:L-lactate dehydrogenase complex protein LldG